ncbi:hypothetical protein GCM10009547_49530 [Sporichthya brevicatena]|uniref:Uncharacterized protein n=1 Tax=Sporichthya brevicatena TaxID=171442 RepID=A0ABN1HDJ2_9ACTN
MTTFLAGQILTADLLNVEDTGWQDVTTLPGFAIQQQPQVRKIGDVIYMRGGWSNTGLSATTNHNVGTVPVGFRPPDGTHDLIIRAGTSGGNSSGVFFVSASGNVQLRTSSTLGSYYICCGSWPATS